MRRVALLIETSRTYGRDLLHGVKRYAQEHGPWSLFVEVRDLETRPPVWLRNWDGDGILTRSAWLLAVGRMLSIVNPSARGLRHRRRGERGNYHYHEHTDAEQRARSRSRPREGVSHGGTKARRFTMMRFMATFASATFHEESVMKGVALMSNQQCVPISETSVSWCLCENQTPLTNLPNF